MPLLARLVVLNLLHVKCKNIYQNPKGFEDTVLSLCCVDKTLMGWHAEKTATLCRERCGGQGYLAINGLGEALVSSHASLTAEGDNRVLMVKVCKDILTNVFKKGHKLPELSQCPKRQIAQADDVCNLKTLLDLFKYREITNLHKLASDTKNLLG